MNIRPASTTLPIPTSGKPCPYDPGLLGGGAVVPYIGSWTGERRCSVQLGWRAGRLAYADEIPIDRDEWGVLWERRTGRIGHGRPLFIDVHPLRQRRVMARLLCQVCAQAAHHTEKGSLWLLPGDRAETFDSTEDLIIDHPPLCVQCARTSVRLCPAMRPHYLAVRAHSEVYGATGLVYRPLTQPPWMETDKDATGKTVPLDHPAIAGIQATQLARRLFNVTVTDLDTLTQI